MNTCGGSEPLLATAPRPDCKHVRCDAAEANVGTLNIGNVHKVHGCFLSPFPLFAPRCNSLITSFMNVPSHDDACD